MSPDNDLSRKQTFSDSSDCWDSDAEKRLNSFSNQNLNTNQMFSIEILMKKDEPVIKEIKSLNLGKIQHWKQVLEFSNIENSEPRKEMRICSINYCCTPLDFSTETLMKHLKAVNTRKNESRGWLIIINTFWTLRTNKIPMQKSW